VELQDRAGEDIYKGMMKVKLGPINANFQGEANVKDLDEANRSGSIAAKGVDRRGGSRASATVEYLLFPADSGTRVDVTADITLQGSMAQFGRTGLIQEVSSRLTKEFASCLGQKLAAATPDEAAEVKAGEVRGFSLFIKSLWARLRRVFGRNRSDVG
jgi:carbon-monoxide dehydrogenase small subunit